MWHVHVYNFCILVCVSHIHFHCMFVYCFYFSYCTVYLCGEYTLYMCVCLNKRLLVSSNLSSNPPTAQISVFHDGIWQSIVGVSTPTHKNKASDPIQPNPTNELTKPMSNLMPMGFWLKLLRIRYFSEISSLHGPRLFMVNQYGRDNNMNSHLLTTSLDAVLISGCTWSLQPLNPLSVQY